MANAIEIYRGDSASFALSVTDVDEAVYNISGMTFLMTVKKNPSQADTDAVLQVSGAIVSATGGTVSFEITEADTSGITPGTYVYDIQGYNSGTGLIQTVTWDKFTVKNDVTKLKVLS